MFYFVLFFWICWICWLIYADHDYAMIHLVSESRSSYYEYVSFKCLRTNARTIAKYFRVWKEIIDAVDYEMITVCLDGRHKRFLEEEEKTDYEIDSRYNMIRNTKENRAQSMRETMRLSVVWWLNQIKIYPQQQICRRRRLFNWIKRRLSFDETSSLFLSLSIYLVYWTFDARDAMLQLKFTFTFTVFENVLQYNISIMLILNICIKCIFRIYMC